MDIKCRFVQWLKANCVQNRIYQNTVINKLDDWQGFDTIF